MNKQISDMFHVTIYQQINDARNYDVQCIFFFFFLKKQEESERAETM